MLKEAKERHQHQLDNKIELNEILTLMTTFKPSDNPFLPVEIEDEPMSLKIEELKKYPEKLPTYRMQVSDQYSFELALKIMFSILKFLPSSYNKHSEYLKGYISLFGLSCKNPDDVSCYEFSDSDRDILIGILAPRILNKQDEDEEIDNLVGGMKDPGSDSSHPQKFSDCLTFADAENQTFLELLELDCFESSPTGEEGQHNSSTIRVDPEDAKELSKSIEEEHFIPYFKKEYKVAFGSPNHFVFIKCLFIMYERLRLARKIIQDRVEVDFAENRDAVIHSYKGYKKSQERIRENRGIHEQPGENSGEAIEDDATIKDRVARHRLAILIGVSVTKFKSKLDTATFEELVRVFLGVKAFFFFTFDKLIGVASKAFHSLYNDEYQKSSSFNLFEKYEGFAGKERAKMHTMYL
mmetsp:Transcript_26223/g.26119  ORF Transcript_26223/g.26119 Transcript_26223/m.26119 type:complete len:410 (+) Transcript_26223:1701-2930(+)